MSLLRDGRVLRRRLAETPDGRAAIEALDGTRLPTRIPRWYRGMHGGPMANGYSFEPILSLSEEPMWRWRPDKVEQGLQRHPECTTPEIRKALDTVNRLLVDPADEFRHVLPTDAIVIINNHLGFHGRTAYTDSERHLLRIKFHDPSVTTE